MRMYRGVIVGILGIVMVIAGGCQPSQETPSVEPSVQEPLEIEEKKPVVEKPAVNAAAKVPVLTVENAVHDFGEMGPGASKKCEYKFTNTGTATLKIDRIQSTCGCTVPKLKKKEYAPGESGTITVTFRAPSVKREVNKSLYIISNNPKNRRFKLAIKAKVVVKVSVEPEKVELRLDQDNAGMPNIVIKSLDDREFAIQSVTVGRQVMTVAFDPTKRAKAFTLDSVVDIAKLNKFVSGVVRIKTDHPQAGMLSVRYKAIPKYEVTRPRFILQNIETGVSLEKDLIIRSNYGTPVELESSTSKNGYMEIVSQERDGEHLKLKIKITPPEKGNSSRRYITDKLSLVLKDQTELAVQCSGWFKLKK
ncbi:MAG: DUF1573 domain-containing protein [Planctomycetota bacterium]